MHLRWTPSAADDLESIADYLHRNRPEYAQRTICRLYDSILRLRKFPASGRPGSKPNTRELILAGLPYIVIFRATDTSVEVLRIHHGAQNWQ